MKKTFTLLAAMLLTTVMYANADRGWSTISVSSNLNNAIRVTVDGRPYNAENNAVLIQNLNAGYHAVKIYQLSSGKRNYFNKYKLVYDANLFVKPRYEIDITINRFGKAFVDENPLEADYHDGDRDDHHDRDEHQDRGNRDWNNQHDNDMTKPMNVQSFDRFRASLRDEDFESTRMNMAKTVIANNNFTTAQVKDILEYFSFESNKLDLAKCAYRSTIDKNEYYTVANSLKFSSDKDELMHFLKTSR